MLRAMGGQRWWVLLLGAFLWLGCGDDDGGDGPIMDAAVADASDVDGFVARRLKDDAELFKQFMDNESFRRWITDTVFGLIYERSNGA